MRLPLFKACSGILTHIGEKYPVPGLHIDFAKKTQTARLYSIYTGKRMQVMMERGDFYVSDTFFPFFATFTDRSLHFVEKYVLTRVNAFYIKMFSRIFSIREARSGRKTG